MSDYEEVQEIDLYNNGVSVGEVLYNCDDATDDISKLELFILTNGIKLHYFCKFCREFIQTPKKFKDHFNTVHEMSLPRFPMACPVSSCNEAFKMDRRVNLTTHVEAIHLGRPLKCTIENCKAEFKSYGSFSSHLRNHKEQQLSRRRRKFKKKRNQNKEISSNYYCSICSEQYNNVSSFSDHFQNDHGIRTPEYPIGCPIEMCMTTFMLAEINKLTIHLRLKHGEEHTLKHSQAKTKNVLERAKIKPISTLRNVELIANKCNISELFYCYQCNDIIVTETNFDRHFVLKHDTPIPLFPLKCPFNDCGATYQKTSKVEFVNHIRSVHLDYKFKCRFCETLFNQADAQLRHELTAHRKEIRHYTKGVQHPKEANQTELTDFMEVEEEAHIIIEVDDDIEENQSTTVQPINQEGSQEFASKFDFLMDFINLSRNESYCGVCEKFFPQLQSFRAMKKHLEMDHAIVTNDPYMCPVTGCNLAYMNKALLLSHIDQIHLGGYVQTYILTHENLTYENFYADKAELIIEIDDDDDEESQAPHLRNEMSTQNYSNLQDQNDSDDVEVIVFHPEDDDDYL